MTGVAHELAHGHLTTVPDHAPDLEPPVGIEPTTCSLRAHKGMAIGCAKAARTLPYVTAGVRRGSVMCGVIVTQLDTPPASFEMAPALRAGLPTAWPAKRAGASQWTRSVGERAFNDAA